MLKAFGKLKIMLKWGKSIEKHQNTSKIYEIFRSHQYFGRLPDIPEPVLHETLHARIFLHSASIYAVKMGPTRAKMLKKHVF